MSTTPRAERHTLYFTEVSDARSGASLGQLVDISLEGLSVQGREPLSSASTRFLRILIPQPGGPDYRLEFEAQSRWTSEADGTHTTGFHITALTPEQQEQVKHLVNASGYRKISEARPLAVPSAARERQHAEPAPGALRRLWQSLFAR